MCALDDFTSMSWLHFAKRKSDIVKFMSNLLGFLKGKGINVEYIHCDNASEHMNKLRTLCHKEGIELDYKAPGSPRHNGLVEKEINLIWEITVTMVVYDNAKKERQVKLWAEAVNCSGLLID